MDANDGSGDDCNLPRDIDGMFFVAGSESGYFIAKSFGQVYFTSNGLAGAASPKPGSAGNGFDQLRRLAGDPANPNRMWAVFPGGGPSYIRRTDDGWNSELDWNIANRDRREITDPHDIDYAGGTIVAAGDAGLIMLSTNGADFFFQDADGRADDAGLARRLGGRRRQRRARRHERQARGHDVRERAAGHRRADGHDRRTIERSSRAAGHVHAQRGRHRRLGHSTRRRSAGRPPGCPTGPATPRASRSPTRASPR